jgi:hypothetical protein
MGEIYQEQNIETKKYAPLNSTKTLLYHAVFLWQPYILKDFLPIIMQIVDNDYHSTIKLIPQNNYRDVIRSKITSFKNDMLFTTEAEKHINYYEHLKEVVEMLQSAYITEKENLICDIGEEEQSRLLHFCRSSILYGICYSSSVRRFFFL